MGARGLFAVVYPSANPFDIQYLVVYKNNVDDSADNIQGCVSSLASDKHGVLVYSLDSNGLPIPTLSALPRHVLVKENG